MRKIFSLFIVIFCTTLFCGCVNDDEEQGVVDLGPGDRIPEFTVEMSDGTVVTNDMLLGKVSVIFFFHTACPDCQMELPVLQQLYETYNDKVEFVGIAAAESLEPISLYWAEEHLTMPYSPQPDRAVLHLFAPGIIPHIFIVDREGIIRNVHIDNPLATYEELSVELDAIL